MSEPRICVVGAGPVGCLLAAALAEHSCHVVWMVRDSARRQAVAQLTLDVAGAPYQPHLERITLPDSMALAEPPDWLVVAVKAQDVETALATYWQSSATRVLVSANGLVAGAFHLGLLYGGAYLDAGRLVTSTANHLTAGPLRGAEGDTVELAALLDAPWLGVATEPDIEVPQWHKLALNCVANPLTALLDCINGDALPLLDGPLAGGLLAECDIVAHAKLIRRWPHTLQSLRSDLRVLLEATRGNSSSMREDLRAGRETEISHMNLAVAEAGAQRGLPCPLNESLGRMVSLISANRGTL